MKKYFTLLVLAILLNSPLATAEETLVSNPIVIVNRALEFGIWRIYNDGDEIFIVDRVDGNYLDTYGSYFYTKEGGLRLRADGTSSRTASSNTKEEALQAESKGQLQDGRYGFLKKRFVVKGDTLTIFTIDKELSPGNVSTYQVLEKYSNGLTHVGTDTTTIVEATKTVDENSNTIPTGMPSNCLASYLPATGEVIIPCLSVEGSNIVYRVKQHQVPGTMTFEVRDGDVSRVE
ncbi:MAG: hypothetical protein L3J59_08830 [Methylococcaceae bacterium]|nr:hypothetical protein [Methylococcaceae bacterium]